MWQNKCLFGRILLIPLVICILTSSGMPEINQNNQAEYSSDPSRASTIKKLNSSWRISSPIKRPKNHELQKESHVDVKDNLFGAKGDGVTDDTKAIQKAVDWLYSRGGGIILFPPGTYIVTSVDIREGITYQGYGATIKRPDHLTGKIGQEKSKWIRTFTTQKYPYSGQEDSPPLIIRGLTFDGSSQAQGFYKNYELEQASQVFLVGDKNYPGRLTAIIEDCNFKNGVADGVHAFINVKLKMQRCKTENIFRGGFVLTGGHSIADIKDLTTIGKRDKTGIDVEVDSAGYGNSKKVEVYLENLRLIDGGFDIGVDSGSIVVGKNIFAEAPFNLYSKNSKARFYQCKFGVGPDNRIIFPNDVKFAECEFYASGRKFKSINKYVIAAPFIAWNISGTNEKNQSLTFTDCSFIADDRVAGLVEPIFGIYTGWDAVDFNNVLTLNGGRFFIKKGTGMGMMYRGGNWVVKNTVFDTDLALFINGFPDQLGQSWFDIVLDGILVKRGHYAHIVGYGPQVAGLSNKNKLEQHHIVVAEDVNYISSTYGLEGNQNIGSRIIQGVNPPTDATHGLVGDIYQLKASSRKWRCTKSGYQIIKNSDKRKIESQWQLIED